MIFALFLFTGTIWMDMFNSFFCITKFLMLGMVVLSLLVFLFLILRIWTLWLVMFWIFDLWHTDDSFRTFCINMFFKCTNFFTLPRKIVWTIALLTAVWKKWTHRRSELHCFVATKLLRRITAVRVGRFHPGVFPDFPPATKLLF